MRLVAACVAIVLSTLAALAAESTETVKYAITRNGYNIGTHTMELRRNGKEVTVKQLTLIEVKIIIVVYHFEQKEEEHWVDNRLVSMDSVVDDNGTPHKLEIRLKDNMLVVTGDGKTRQVSPTMMPATLWNAAIVKQTNVLNVRDGTNMKVTVTDMGSEDVTVRGRSVKAHRYQIKGPFTQDAWYDDKGNLVQAMFAGSDGSDIYWQMI